MKKNDKKGFKQLNDQQLSKLKGGYRHIPGAVAEMNSFRWDEVVLRLDAFDDSFGSGDPRVIPSLDQEPTPSESRRNGFTKIY